MPTYCKETWNLNNSIESVYFPMISFCDLPLSLIKEHIQRYGNYGIGMKKDWGILKKLNPVIYIESNSIIARDLDDSLLHLNDLYDAIEEFSKNLNKRSSMKFLNVDKTMVKAGKLHLNIFRYLKNYEGALNRNGKIIKKYRFYDEREWRYVPEFDNKDIKNHLDNKAYARYRQKSKAKPLLDKIVLEFTADDIEYLIVKSNKDIPRLIKKIQGTNNLAKNGDKLLELTTRILTIEQLDKDF